MAPIPSRRRQLISAMNWMGGLTLLLFWLPVAGPLLAGLVGGWKAGSVGRAILAVFLPAVLLAVMTFAGVTYLFDSLWGILAGAGALAVGLFHITPLLAGALAGGVGTQLRGWVRGRVEDSGPGRQAHHRSQR